MTNIFPFQLRHSFVAFKDDCRYHIYWPTAIFLHSNSDHNTPQKLNMADPTLYTYPSPLEGYQNLEPLPEYGLGDISVTNKGVRVRADDCQ